MNLDELQSIRDRERQSDSLQQLRETFYADVAEFVQTLRDERDAAAARADDPFDSPEVSRLTDDIKTAEQTIEAIYERRVGKLVKMSSFAAADMPTEDDGLTAEEQELFEQMVSSIEQNREQVLGTLNNTTDAEASSDPTDSTPATEPSPQSTTAPSKQPDRETPDSAPNPDPESDPGPAPNLNPDGTGGPAPNLNPDGTGGGDGDGDINAADIMAGSDQTPPHEDPPVPPHENGPTQPPEDGLEDTHPAKAGDDQSEERTTETEAEAEAEAEVDKPSLAAEKVESQSQSRSDIASSNDRGDQRSNGRHEQGKRVKSDGVAGAGGQRGDNKMDDGTEAGTTTARGTVTRETVRITADVGEILGVDQREYELECGDIVTLPAANVEPLVQRSAAKRLDKDE